MENKTVAAVLIIASFISGIGLTIIADSIVEHREKTRREQEVKQFAERFFGNVEQKRK